MRLLTSQIGGGGQRQWRRLADRDDMKVAAQMAHEFNEVECIVFDVEFALADRDVAGVVPVGDIHFAIRQEAGDRRSIMVGRVTGFDQDEASGLGFYNAGYFSLQQERLADAAASRELRTRASIILEADGAIMAGPDGGLPGVMLDGRDGARTALTAHLSRLGIAARLGPVFAIYDTPNDGSRHIVLRGQLMAPAKTTTSGMVAIDDIGAVAFADEALGDMLVRFADEFRNQSFGLYIGSADAGEVHTLNEE